MDREFEAEKEGEFEGELEGELEGEFEGELEGEEFLGTIARGIGSLLQSIDVAQNITRSSCGVSAFVKHPVDRAHAACRVTLQILL